MAYVSRVRDVTCDAVVDPAAVTLEAVEANPVRCPDPEVAEEMYKGEELGTRWWKAGRGV